MIDFLSGALQISNDAIENLLGTFLIFTRYLKNKISEKYKEQVVKEVVPHVLKLLANYSWWSKSDLDAVFIDI